MCMSQGGAQASSSEGSTSSDSTPQPSSSMSDVEQQLGVSPEQLMQRLLTRPDLLAKVQDPEVGVLTCSVSLPRGRQECNWSHTA
jgi:hypothetical protein